MSTQKKDINQQPTSFWHEFMIAAKETPRLYFRPITIPIKYLLMKIRAKNKPD